MADLGREHLGTAPTRAIDLVRSGSPEVVAIERGEWSRVRKVAKTLAMAIE